MPPVFVQHPISCIAGAIAACALIVAEPYRVGAKGHLSEVGERTWWLKWTKGGLLFADQKYFTEEGWRYRAKYYRVSYVFWAGVLIAVFAW